MEKRRKKAKKEQWNDTEIQELEKRVQAEAPARGTVSVQTGATKFTDFPLSQHTQSGLDAGGFKTLTEIQTAALPHALCGRDVLGAAKTGSGKTLAFLIPVLEKLYRLKWSNRLDGLGALIISPTRELALQIFEVLRVVGKYHSFSAGLIIGGKDLSEEQEQITLMNILICTPGRLLQHMDETVGFDSSNLKILVLDEADRLLDMGFSKTLNAIIENLPKERQTLLFSATQTSSIRDLARLSLENPEYVAVHEKAKFSTPQKLVQNVIVCELHEKINILWSFVKSHLESKCIVFLTSCKQVHFVFESFRRLRPGIPLMELHGKQKQTKRMSIYFDFCKKKNAVLFATDVASRGLDFTAVDWVVQVDCPEDVQTYIHRVGRTARYQAGGCSLLLLLPSEEKMITLLEGARIPVSKIKVNPSQQRDIRPNLEALLSADLELKHLAQKAFVSYMRSIFLFSNKELFQVDQVAVEPFARSLGLIVTPRIRFSKSKKESDGETTDQSKTLEQSKEDKLRNPQSTSEKLVKLFNRQNNTVLSKSWARLREDIEESDDELFTKKPQKLEESDSDNFDLPEELDDSKSTIPEDTMSAQSTTTLESNKSSKFHNKKRKKVETDSNQQQRTKKKSNSTGNLTLEEQEQLALKILEG